MDTRKVAVLGHINRNLSSTIANILEKERGIEIVNLDNIQDGKEIVENSDLIIEQDSIKNSYPIHMLPPVDPTVNYSHSKRTDGERLKDHGIDSLDRLLEECILISQKQSKLPRSIRELVVKYSIEAYRELNVKAEEIKKESLENNSKEDDRKEQ